MEIYYREKVLKLLDRLFIETGDARNRIISCEDYIESTYLASKNDSTPEMIKDKWNKIWAELNSKAPIKRKNEIEVRSSLAMTVASKQNRTMNKYLTFFLEEFYRVI